MSAERTIPVEIVRPKQPWWASLIVGASGLLIRAWIAMLCLGALLPHLGISYGQTLLGLFVINSTHPTDWLTWTRTARSK